MIEYTPSLATGRHALYRRALAVRGLLAHHFPLCFAKRNEPKQPLKIGIHLDLLPFFAPEHHNDLHNALADYTNRTPFQERNNHVRIMTKRASYLRCLIEGAVRVDLDGNPAGVVSPQSAAYAADLIKQLEKHQAYEQLRYPHGRSHKPGKSNPNAAAGGKADARDGPGIGRRRYHDGPADHSSGHATGTAAVHRVGTEVTHEATQ